MDQCEDREEGVPPSKTTLCGGDESQSKGQRIHRRLKPEPEPEPEPSCVSFKSDRSKENPIHFKSAGSPPSERTFNEKLLEISSEEQRRSSREAVMKITLNFLRMKQENLAEHLQRRHLAAVCQHKLKSGLKKKFQSVFEGIAKAGSPTLLNQIYTDLYITEGRTGEVNNEHEVRQIETASRKPHRPETIIRREDIFKVPPGRDQPIRTVMTKEWLALGKQS
ncbi:uncharacterized protein LOC129366341 [Poeciliopsis prolifica]|uniref:uncharacterized protein LOC129366341 n=1 Tax=Poeciliopsis prolifica TaxID=188132 RepID=UPI00241306DB|nr:uncharacterized protein LOC129366341 [Poeciliopsis prolifica]